MELFYKLTGESSESFYEGITTQVKVINVMTNEKYSGLRVSTDSGIEGKIDIKDIKDLGPDENQMNPEELKTIAKVGMQLNVRVKSIKTEDTKKVSVFFSSKISDLNLIYKKEILSKKTDYLDPSFVYEDEDLLN